jgi:hypothetical protein
MTLQGAVTASAAAERAVEVAVTALGALIVGFLVLEALYLAAFVLYLGCAHRRRAVPEQGTKPAGAGSPVPTQRRARRPWQREPAAVS